MLYLLKTMLADLQNATAPVSDPPKVHCVWRIRHAPCNICGQSKKRGYVVLAIGQRPN